MFQGIITGIKWIGSCLIADHIISMHENRNSYAYRAYKRWVKKENLGEDKNAENADTN